MPLDKYEERKESPIVANDQMTKHNFTVNHQKYYLYGPHRKLLSKAQATRYTRHFQAIRQQNRPLRQWRGIDTRLLQYAVYT